MNKSECVKADPCRGFQAGESKITKKKCYGYSLMLAFKLIADP